MVTSDKLQLLISTKNNFKNVLNSYQENAITEKTPFSQYPKIAEKLMSNENEGEKFLINDAQYLFYYGSRLQQIDKILEHLDVSINDFKNMFGYCTNNTDENVQKFVNFINNNKMELKNISYMFTNNAQITTISKINTSLVEDAAFLFAYCSSLVTLPALNFSSVKSLNNIVKSCSKLQNLGGFEDLGKAYSQQTNNFANYKLDLSSNNLLTHDSLMNVINGLYDLNITYNVYDEEKNLGSGILYEQQLQLGETNIAKLNDEDIAIATSKGWIVL